MSGMLNLSDVMSGLVCASSTKFQGKSDNKVVMDFVEQTLNSVIARKSAGKVEVFKQFPLKEDYALQATMRAAYNAVRYNETSLRKLSENSLRGALSGWLGDELTKMLGGDYALM